MSTAQENVIIILQTSMSETPDVIYSNIVLTHGIRNTFVLRGSFGKHCVLSVVPFTVDYIECILTIQLTVCSIGGT